VSGIGALGLVAASSAALAAALLARLVVPPPAPLRVRLDPYVGGRSALEPGGRRGVTAVVRGLVADAATAVARLVDASGDDALALRLRQAGVFDAIAAEERVAAFRIRQLAAIVGGATLGALSGAITGRGAPMVLLLVGLGIGWGATFWKGRIGAAIEARRRTLRIELYTIDQLLAMRVRLGRGVIGAVRTTVHRTRGEVAADLAEALRLHRGGLAGSDAFRRIAVVSPEPHARRLYELLATAEERGTDLAPALLALANDVRDDRRDALRRRATKRRAAMLLPILGLLAPVLVMFVAAPLPSIIFGELR
jgi:tight adherence protein C